jgi:hypothetical protein
MGIHNAGVATHNQRTDMTFIASKAPKASKTDIAATLPEKETKRAPVLGILGSRCHLLCRRVLQINRSEISPAIWTMVCQQQLSP